MRAVRPGPSGSRKEPPRIRTITSATAREYTREFLSPAELQPYEVAEILGSDIDAGLSPQAVSAARRKHGGNIIREELTLSFGSSLRRQLLGIYGLLLFLCAVIMYVFTTEEIYILLSAGTAAVTLVNAYMEHVSYRSIKNTLKRASPKAAVVRGGREFSVDSRALVPGDVILLESGAIVPADARLIESNGLFVLETVITKSRESVPKDASFLSDGQTDAISPNMVYALSVVTGGRAKAIVTATGKDTAVRLLAGDRTRDPMPALLRYIRSAGRFLSLFAVAASFVLMLIGLIAGRDIVNVFMISLAVGYVSLTDSAFSLASAAVGKGMRMAGEYGASLKNLNSITKLCFIDTVMCEKNSAFPPRQLTAQTVYADGKRLPMDRQHLGDIEEVIKYSLVCSSFREKFDKQSAMRRKKNLDMFYEGSLSDLALIRACGELGIDISRLGSDYFKIETEYSSGGEALRTLVLHEGRNIVILKGAPEMVVTRCAGYQADGAVRRMTAAVAGRLMDVAEQMSKESMTVYAVAAGVTECDSLKRMDAEKKLVFRGFIGYYCSMYVDSASAVYKCTRAGIEPVVRTDESFFTAVNNAKNSGIITDESQVITSEQIKSMDRGLYIANCPEYKVFKDVSDAEWLDVLRLRREDGKAVAVTAERLEDLGLMNEADASFVSNSQAPETIIQTADVLIGSGGFDVITHVLESARSIYKRVYSVVQYLTVAYATLLFAGLAAVITGLEFPFRVNEILLGGLAFNMLFAVSLSLAPTHRKILTDRIPRYTAKPRPGDFLVPAVYSAFSAMSLFFAYFADGAGGTAGYSRVLVTLTLLLFAFAFSGSSKQSMITSRAYRNYLLLPALAVCAAFTALLLYYKPVSEMFGYSPLGVTDILISVGMAAIVFILMQLTLFLIEVKKNKKPSSLRSGGSGDGQGKENQK